MHLYSGTYGRDVNVSGYDTYQPQHVTTTKWQNFLLLSYSDKTLGGWSKLE
jgi:hypothetical protein